MISKGLKFLIWFAITLWITGCILSGAYLLAKGFHDYLGW